MRRLIFAFLWIGFASVFAQSSLQKISTKLQLKLQSDIQSAKHLVWIYFSDKGENPDSYFLNPQNVVSQKSLNRRAKVLDQSNLLKFTDLPVNQNYVNELVQLGFELKQKSKWFNAVSGYASETLINQIAQNLFVKLIDVVGTYGIRKNDFEFKQKGSSNDNPLQPEGVHTLDYGNSFTQLNQINVPALHDLGYNGAGLTICVMDAGFANLTHEVFSNMNIAATYDFVVGSPTLVDHFHGTATLSLIGGYKEGQLIGPAYGATYLLARTENDPGSETPQEEDNWIAAMEWADSIGVDVTSTSLGYLTFDLPFTSYSWEDMDGNTARITIAADYAVSLGITVVNSAGNSGYNPLHNTLNAPADGDSVITIGAVTSSGTRASFSSVGPTIDGRIKPDLMAMGEFNYYALTTGNLYGYGNGTSFSCPLVAGVCALLLDLNPNLMPMELLQILRSTASQSTTPDNLYGWGIVNALDAINLIPVPVELTTFNAVYSNGKVILEWITATETNNYGFEIQRRDDSSSFETIAFISGNGTTTNRVTYSYIDNNLYSGRYYYRLKQLDYNGSFEYSDEVLVDIPLLTDFKLYQNYPNPFNPSTKIKFYTPIQDRVKIGLYDILGNEIRILFDNEVSQGSYEIELDGSDLTSGMYFVKLIGKQNQQVIKISMIK
jgi:subtilisin family serine protease